MMRLNKPPQHVAMIFQVLSTPFGHLKIWTTPTHVVGVELSPIPQDSIKAKQDKKIQPIAEYFKHPQIIQTHYLYKGTPFQEKIWQAIANIPLGKTVTYGDLAKRYHTSARAIGMACRANPLPIVIPCHRVVGKGHLGGFAGDTAGKLIKIKQWLLAHEGISC